MIVIKSKEIIDDFNITINSTDFHEIYDSLLKLRPDKLGSDKLVELVKYVEQNAVSHSSTVKHYNSFGTGGDNLKTINLSTIASIIASNFVTVYKVGTRAVTSKWGSYEFVNALSSRLHQIPQPLRDKAFYQSGSKYIPLSDLGYAYSGILREARLELYKQNIPDVYKVVFPASNLTSSSGQVNGVYSSLYLGYFVDISIALQRNSLIVHSYYGIDEIFAGKNLVIRVINGTATQNELTLPDHAPNDKYFNFITESEYVDEHILRFINILQNDCPYDVILTVSYNAACILNLAHPTVSIDFLAEKIISFLVSNTSIHTVKN